MPKLSLTTLIVLTTVFAGTGTAFAQDTDWTTEPEMAVNHFVTADADASGTLTLEEFQVYAVSQAEAGDVDYADLTASGEYAQYFAAKDLDADGYVSEAELAPVISEDIIPDPNIIDNPDMIEE